MKCLDKEAKKDLFNKVVYWVIKPWVLIIVFVFIFTPSCKILKAIETGADFLNIVPGARPSGMANSFTGVFKDLNSVYFNPAGLAWIDRRELSLAHCDLFMNEKYDFASFGLPFRRIVSAFTISRLDHGGFQSRDENGRISGSFNASDTLIGISFARFIGYNSAIGAGIKFLSSEIAEYNARTFAFDLGFLQRINGLPVSFGFSIRNIGNGMKFIDERENLPLSINAGLSFRPFSFMDLTLDIKHLVYDKETYLSIGTEYNLFGGLFLRGGYSTGIFSSGSDLFKNFSGGIGLNLSNIQIDYSLTPSEFGTFQRFSFDYRF